MKNQYSQLYAKIFFIAVLVGIVGVSAIIIWPFLTSLLAGGIIAYMAYPIYKYTNKRIKNKNITAFLVAIIITSIIGVPLLLVFVSLANQVIAITSMFQTQGIELSLDALNCDGKDQAFCTKLRSLLSFLPESQANRYVQDVIEKAVNFVIQIMSGVVLAVPSLVLGFVVALFAVFYFLRDGPEILQKLEDLIPLDAKHKASVLLRFKQITYAVFFGNISVAFIQGGLGGLGFFVLGLPNPLLWGFVMSLLALIPMVGTGIVWIPTALYLIGVGFFGNYTPSLVKGIILLVYGLLVISTIDNILKPKIIGDKGGVHPLLILIGILGGIQIFGIAGLILGPVCLSLLIVFAEVYQNKRREAHTNHEKKEHKDNDHDREGPLHKLLHPFGHEEVEK